MLHFHLSSEAEVLLNTVQCALPLTQWQYGKSTDRAVVSSPGWGVGEWDRPLQSLFASLGNSSLNIFPSYSHYLSSLPGPTISWLSWLWKRTVFQTHLLSWLMTNPILYLKVPWLDVTDVVLHHTLIQVPLKYICFIFSITKWSNTGKAQGGQWCDQGSFPSHPDSLFLLDSYCPACPACYNDSTAPIVLQPSPSDNFEGHRTMGGGGADIYSSGPGPRSNCPPWHQADHQALFLVRTLAGPWLQYRTDWQAHLLCFHWTLHSYTNCFYFLILLKTAPVQSWTSLYFKESQVGSRILFKS